MTVMRHFFVLNKFVVAVQESLDTFKSKKKKWVTSF